MSSDTMTVLDEMAQRVDDFQGYVDTLPGDIGVFFRLLPWDVKARILAGFADTITASVERECQRLLGTDEPLGPMREGE